MSIRSLRRSILLRGLSPSSSLPWEKRSCSQLRRRWQQANSRRLEICGRRQYCISSRICVCPSGRTCWQSLRNELVITELAPRLWFSGSRVRLTFAACFLLLNLVVVCFVTESSEAMVKAAVEEKPQEPPCALPSCASADSADAQQLCTAPLAHINAEFDVISTYRARALCAPTSSSCLASPSLLPPDFPTSHFPLLFYDLARARSSCFSPSYPTFSSATGASLRT